MESKEKRLFNSLSNENKKRAIKEVCSKLNRAPASVRNKWFYLDEIPEKSRQSVNKILKEIFLQQVNEALPELNISKSTLIKV